MEGTDLSLGREMGAQMDIDEQSGY